MPQFKIDVLVVKPEEVARWGDTFPHYEDEINNKLQQHGITFTVEDIDSVTRVLHYVCDSATKWINFLDFMEKDPIWQHREQYMNEHKILRGIINSGYI